MNFFSSVNPRTGAVIGAYPVMADADVAGAVERARRQSLVWAEQSIGERAAALTRLRDAIAADAEGLAHVVTQEIGKPPQEALAADVLALADALNWLTARLPRLLSPQRIPGERRAERQPLPYGVVGIIGTWNYPLLLDGASLAWALAAGNAVVWKPSELATASALRLHAHCERADLPVFMLTGEGTTGRALCQMPIDKLAFTGGVATGRAILGQLAQRGIPSVMELSGNDAMIVCADADLEATARAAVWARICNAGQSCVSPQRIYVAAAVYEPFVTLCQNILRGLRAGVDYGPLRTEGFRQRAHSLVREAIEQGACLRAGGKCLAEPDFTGGFYYAPTLLAECRDDLQIMREDCFGPVLCVRAFTSVEEAITLANAVEMGLGASVWTQNPTQGRRIVAGLRAGIVTVNMEALLTGARPGLPFGGMGASGFGRQRGAAGLDEFIQWKTVCWQKATGAQRHVFPYKEATLPILRSLLAFKMAKGGSAKISALRQLADAARQWNK